MKIGYLGLLNGIVKGWQAEYRFHPTRRWKSDYANPKIKTIIEIEGGVFTSGRHTRGTGFIKDCEKYNAASIAGWKILRYTPDQMRAGRFGVDILTILDHTPSKANNDGELKRHT
ncbi:MAG: hypothetical protein WA066_02810 [Candidatus Omnitrophota bacterium]